MSADVELLREAAKEMRERAVPATTWPCWSREAAVALAVADWLDTHAHDLASAGGYPLACDSPGDLEHAVTVARAYLGRNS